MGLKALAQPYNATRLPPGFHALEDTQISIPQTKNQPMKKIVTLVLLSIAVAGHAADSTPAPATPPAAQAAAVDPKFAELTAKVAELTQQLEAQGRATQTVQEQRNALAAQLLDAQATLRLTQQNTAALQQKLDEATKKTAEAATAADAKK